MCRSFRGPQGHDEGVVRYALVEQVGIIAANSSLVKKGRLGTPVFYF